MKVAVLFGSVRVHRQGIGLARFVVKQLEQRGCTPTLVDPAEVRLPLLEMQYSEYPAGTAPENLERLAQLYRSVDGFAIVSAEYNHGIPPALKNLLDYFLEEYFWRPAAIVSYSGGRFGGVRAAMQLRMTLAELGMVTIPTTLPVGNVGESFDEHGVPLDPRWLTRTGQFFDEFFWYMEALSKQRAAAGLPY